uniref:SUEL-type lectin domain-containing protein n=1 Tax=Nothobranchius furzeri TaxID=105023 RepID=A0A8C6K5W4_NOTFU
YFHVHFCFVWLQANNSAFILKNHTAHACEGDILIIKCPRRTSVAVLSAFYGRRVPDKYLCPSVNTNMTGERDTECTSPVANEDQQSCHIPVLAPVFGPDSCPLTSKYLLVYYKCRPERWNTRVKVKYLIGANK